MNNTTPSRRGALAIAGAALAGAGAAGAGRASAAEAQATFVLIHGAWHGGWCWERVATRLRARGHRVFAPTLTGLCERAHLLAPGVNLSTHVADVTGEITWKDLTNVVLVGHSYGGMVVTGAAQHVPERIASIVYLDAFLPTDGQSTLDIAGVKDPGVPVIQPPPAGRFVGERDVAWVQSKMTPQPAATFTERLTATDAVGRLKKRTYIRATVGDAPYFVAAHAKVAKNPAWNAREIDCHHDAMLDEPDKLTDLLIQAI